MVPGVSLFTGYNFDSNRFLVNNTWNELGVKATMSLFNLINGPMQIQAANTKVDVTRTRRLAQTVAALVQIHLSYYQYKQALEDYAYSSKITRLEGQIFSIAKNERSLEVQSKLTLIRRSVSAVRAEIEHDRILSDIYMYWGNMYFSLGGDLVPQNFTDENLAAMTTAVRERMDHWWKGELPFEQPTEQSGDQTAGQAKGQPVEQAPETHAPAVTTAQAEQ